MENDLGYFRRRAAQERAAALWAAHPRAQQAHLVLAHEYDNLIGRLAANERELEIDQPPALTSILQILRKETVRGGPLG